MVNVTGVKIVASSNEVAKMALRPAGCGGSGKILRVSEMDVKRDGLKVIPFSIISGSSFPPNFAEVF